MRTLIGFRQVVFAAVAAMGVSAFGEDASEYRAPIWFPGNPPAGVGLEVSNREENPFSMLDGSKTSYFTFYSNRVGPHILDLGSLKTITRIVVYPPSNDPNNYWWSRRGGYKLTVSSDGETWAEAGSMPYQSDLVSLDGDSFPLPEELAGRKFRYVAISALHGMGSLGELEVYTSDLSLTIDMPSLCADALGAVQEESSKGVKISGKAYGLNGVEAKVYAYAARKDFGNDYDAWKANGVEFLLTEEPIVVSAEGTAYSGFLKDLPKGFFCVRTFLVAGDVKVASHKTQTFASKTKPATKIRAYITSKKNGANTIRWVNGVAETSRQEDANASVQIIFDLDQYTKAGQFVSAVRLFSAACPERRNGAVLQYAYEDPENPVVWTDTENLYTSEDRVLDYLPNASVPAMTWVNMGNFADSQRGKEWNTGYQVPLEASLFPSAYEDFLLKKRKLGQLPRYLKVSNIISFDITEVELRLSKIPSEGLAISVQ